MRRDGNGNVRLAMAVDGQQAKACIIDFDTQRALCGNECAWYHVTPFALDGSPVCSFCLDEHTTLRYADMIGDPPQPVEIEMLNALSFMEERLAALEERVLLLEEERPR